MLNWNDEFYDVRGECQIEGVVNIDRTGMSSGFIAVLI